MLDSSSCCVKLNYFTEQQANKVNPWTIERSNGGKLKMRLKNNIRPKEKGRF